MDNYKKFGLIAGQVLIGLGFGFVGAIAFGLLIILYFELVGRHLDLFGEIMCAVIGGYIGMQTGIGFDGYKFLKQNERAKDFPRFLVQSMGGLILGILAFYLTFSTGNKMNNSLVNILAIVLPLTGAIIGFNLGLAKGLNDFEKKDG